MKLLESKRFKLPKVFFITDREQIKDVPIGVPFIFGEDKNKEDLIRVLEYEVLYQKAISSGYPFNFKRILLDAGFLDLESFNYDNPMYLEFTSEGLPDDIEIGDLKEFDKSKQSFKKYLRDSAAYVDIQKLKDLNVFPLWLDKIEDAIKTNIHNFATFNSNMYNKKLEGMYGGLELHSPNKNLIIIDISSSIPKAVSSTCLTLAKNLSESFYADLLITGSKSTLYAYENIHELNINTIYEENGTDNDQAWFKKLVESEEKSYKTAIVFGDNHSPCQAWSNEFNKKTKRISREDGQKLCKWNIEKLISFHTSSINYIAGYADWFKPKEVEKIDDWVKYLD